MRALMSFFMMSSVSSFCSSGTVVLNACGVRKRAF